MNIANKNGLLLGLLCPGELKVNKEPVAYLYNNWPENDICVVGGSSVVFDASDPIPVYE